MYIIITRKNKVVWLLSYNPKYKHIYQPSKMVINYMIGLRCIEYKDVIFYYESKDTCIVKWLELLSRKRNPRLGCKSNNSKPNLGRGL